MFAKTGQGSMAVYILALTIAYTGKYTYYVLHIITNVSTSIIYNSNTGIGNEHIFVTVIIGTYCPDVCTSDH